MSCFKNLVVIFFLVFISCKKEKTERNVNLKDVIKNGKIIPFDSLTDIQKLSVNNCFYYPYGNWRDLKEYKKENSYFVKVKIDFTLLAEIQKYNYKYEESQQRTNPLLMYGKYQNRWQFYDENNLLMNSSNKFEGHNIFDFKRENSFDYITIGPIQAKPSKIEIKILIDNYEYEEYPFYNF